MEFIYVHDSKEKVVYRMPSKPNIITDVDKRGRLLGLVLNVTIEITSAKNKLLSGNRWQMDTTNFIREDFDSRYDVERATSYFYQRNIPIGERISDVLYHELKAQYELEARSN
jgi:hypothetical protein